LVVPHPPAWPGIRVQDWFTPYPAPAPARAPAPAPAPLPHLTRPGPDLRLVRETLGGQHGTNMGITASPDGRTAWTAGRDGDLLAWDLDGDRRKPRQRLAEVGASWGQPSADGNRAAVWIPGTPTSPSHLAVVNLAEEQTLLAPFPGLTGRPAPTAAAEAGTSPRGAGTG
jgi:hypothetical protein